MCLLNKDYQEDSYVIGIQRENVYDHKLVLLSVEDQKIEILY